MTTPPPFKSPPRARSPRRAESLRRCRNRDHPAHRRDRDPLKTVYDPEIPADIYEIGLIYRIDIADDRTVKVDMSLTSPNCPSAQELPVMVQNAVSTVAGVGKVDVSVVWDPPWDPSRMSEEARVVLNMF